MSWYEAPSPSRVQSKRFVGYPTGDMNDSEHVQDTSQSNAQRPVLTSPPFPLEQGWPYYPFHGLSHLVADGSNHPPQSADYYQQTANPGMPTQYNHRIFNLGQARQMNTYNPSTSPRISFLTQNQTTNTIQRGLFGIPESDNVRGDTHRRIYSRYGGKSHFLRCLKLNIPYIKDQSQPSFSGTQALPLIATKCARRIIAPAFLDTLQEFIPSLFASVASPSNDLPMGSSLEVVKRRSYFEQHLPADALLIELACFIVNQTWFTSHDREPPIQETEEAVQSGRLPHGPSHSRFDLFFDARDKHRCVWIDKNQCCSHQAQRLGRARGHAHLHFKYKPFACEGGCGVPQW